ncbi:Caspase domain-containing protein [Archangium lansingense]|uniref:Caspase domain-containing protein n=1 Tax=Archangium lansingense TaxID=2995310 RepID=A0ABT4A0M0_9BACT|nr:Caspase domain-containing protein [Archangium lansinium]MCY1075193.1 Caspase domain-containing protein [Archangium lansinium]
MRRGLRAKSGVVVLWWMGMLGCAGAPISDDTEYAAEWPVPSPEDDKEAEEAEPVSPLASLVAPPRASNFLVLGGGGEPSSNEIALEKNVRYFQRTLEAHGLAPASATVYFANGNDGQATVRYLGEGAREQFKALEIPHLKGPATLEHFLEWVEQSARDTPQQPVFIYFTGHGGLNGRHRNNNHLALWEGDSLTVRAFGLFLNRLPSTTPVVTVMSQCYAGSFANFIYQDANPKRPVVAQPRCGFFATVDYLPSVGCTPEVDEADYKDYSSSFFAGLSGLGRTGKVVTSADYDGDGRVSYAEAHAFAKVDGETTDLPISTSESWLQRRVKRRDRSRLTSAPIQEVMRSGRPAQRYVVESLVRKLGLLPGLSLRDNFKLLKLETDESAAYAERLYMELLNIGMEEKLRTSGSPQALAVFERLLQCENGSWDRPPGAVPVATPEVEATAQ